MTVNVLFDESKLKGALLHLECAGNTNKYYAQEIGACWTIDSRFIDDEGYDEDGVYYGTGQALWDASSDGVARYATITFRADTLADAERIVREFDTTATFAHALPQTA
jgi:hypothetical protein